MWLDPLAEGTVTTIEEESLKVERRKGRRGDGSGGGGGRGSQAGDRGRQGYVLLHPLSQITNG